MSDIAELTRRLVADVWNAGREESAGDLVGADCAGLGGTGPAAVLAWHRDRRQSFPDLRYEIVDLVADTEMVALRWRATGTQHGAFGPVPPTGRAVDYSGATFLRFAGGRVAEVWSVNELFEVLRQLGVEIRPPGPAGPDC